MRYTKLSFMLLCALSLATILFGCGSSSNREGTADGSADSVASVGDLKCTQCHSAVVDPLTGVGIIQQYEFTSPHKDSPHANNGNGCEACHGGGAQHNGVGPIPVPNPYAGNGTRCAVCHKGTYQTNAPTKFADSLHGDMTLETSASCRRCHTHEGAVLGLISGLTGSGGVMDNAVYQGAVPLQSAFSKFECATCHEHGAGLRSVKARDGSGNIVNWNPSKSNMANDQYNLCTSCHTLKSFDGNKVLASGNIVTYNTFTVATDKVGHHETSWYRVIATTHLNNSDNPTAGGISGYVIRIPKTAEDAYDSTTNPEAKPCFDCHGHEAKTHTINSNPGSADYDEAEATIWTEWAKSGHAGRLLEAKVTAVGSAARSTAAVDTAMTTTVNDTTAAGWYHYDWSATNRQDCQRCHTATGASNFLSGPATYDKTKNDFQHLASWSTTTRSSKQREMLYCWGCHANVSGEDGGLRNPGAFTSLDYNFNGAKAAFPDVDASNVCIACHSGRASGETITSLPTASFANVGFQNSHYMAAAGLMYNKSGFTAFIDPTTVIGTTTYGTSLTSCDDNANASGCISSTHRKLGSAAMIGDHGVTAADTQLLSGGPCVVCHMTKIGTADRHHTLEIDDNAVSNVCLKCHDAELTTALTTTNFDSAFLTPQEDAFDDALTLALTVLKNNYNISYSQAVYPYFYDDSLLPTVAAVTDWTRGGTLTSDEALKLMGACFNINLLRRDPAAFAHARTYSRRLVYDTIDFLDDKTINLTAGATAIAESLVVGSPVEGLFGKGAAAFTDSTLTVISPGTTEAMIYLIKWSRTTGAWSSPERP